MLIPLLQRLLLFCMAGSVRGLDSIQHWFSDNSPQLTSKEFADKITKLGVKHILTPPYHPASNGLAERAVGLVKDKLKKMDVSASPIELYVNLKYILKVHGATINSSTGQSPFEMISKAPVPRLFPQLVISHRQQVDQEKNVIVQSQDKIKNVRCCSRMVSRPTHSRI